MADPFIAEIKIFAGNFAPRGYAFCEGQLLPIAQNTALFSLLGNTYGGDGRSTFGLPDLRDRLALHPGDGPGLTPRRLGERGGAATVTLTGNEVPTHGHTLLATSSANTREPAGASLANTATGARAYRQPGAKAPMAAAALASAGQSAAHPNRQPTLGLNHIIALVGAYPSRS